MFPYKEILITVTIAVVREENLTPKTSMQEANRNFPAFENHNQLYNGQKFGSGRLFCNFVFYLDKYCPLTQGIEDVTNYLSSPNPQAALSMSL